MGRYVDRKDRWFKPVKYNMTRVFNRFAELVEESGGTVERHDDERLVHTRGYDEEIHRTSKHLSYLEKETDPDTKDAREKALKKLRERAEELERLEAAAPVVSTNFVSLIADLWIKFELDGFKYYFETEDNPFFPDSYMKTPVGSKETHYLEKIECGDKTYYPDDMFKPVAANETIEYSASVLLKMLTQKPACEVCRR